MNNSMTYGNIRTAAILVLCLLGAACSSSNALLTASQCDASVGSLATANDYLIGPGDNLEIVVWRNAELSVRVPVRPDGKISTPLVDDMQAAGKRPSTLARDMEAVLSEYLRTPKVSVMVTEQGAANQIQVVGEVVNPKALPYRAGLRILDAIVEVGGLTEFAAGNRTNLVRQTKKGQIKCRIQVDSLMTGDLSENIALYPGDVLVIPETRF